MDSHYRNATFLKSSSALADLPEDKGFEVAFVGCSNVGKSSTLNTLVDNAKLARTSKTPGRTQLINLFSLDATRRLVDLPGFGYADVPEEVKIKWQRLMDAYLRERRCLVGVVLIMDIRTPFKPFEKQMITWGVASRVPMHLVLNKIDKLSTSAVKSARARVEKALEDYDDVPSIQLFSAKEKTGLEQLRHTLDVWYEY